MIDDHEAFGPFRIETDPAMPRGVVGFRGPTHTVQRRTVQNGTPSRAIGTELLLVHERPQGGTPVVIARAFGVWTAPLPQLPSTTLCRECGALVAANGAQLTAATNPEGGRAVTTAEHWRVAFDPADIGRSLIFVPEDGPIRTLGGSEVARAWDELARQFRRETDNVVPTTTPAESLRESMRRALDRMREAARAARESARVAAFGPPNTVAATAGAVAVGPGIYVTPVAHNTTPGRGPGEGGDQA